MRTIKSHGMKEELKVHYGKTDMYFCSKQIFK